MTDDELYAAITTRESLMRDYPAYSRWHDKHDRKRSLDIFWDRRALNAAIVAELSRRLRTFEHSGRSWGLTFDCLNYLELEPGRLSPRHQWQGSGAEARLVFDYGEGVC